MVTQTRTLNGKIGLWIIPFLGLLSLALENQGNQAMLSQIIALNQDKSINLDFAAQSLLVNNPTGQYIYVNPGSNEIPDVAGAKITIPPGTYVSQPIPPSRAFGIHLGAATLPTSSYVAGPTLTFYDQPQAVQIANIAQPNVINQATWSFGLYTLAGNSSQAIVTPAAGHSVVVYKSVLFYVMGAPPPSLIVFSAFRGTTYAVGTEVWNHAVWFYSTTAYTARHTTDEASFLPYGFTLPAGVSLSLYNGDAAQQTPYYGVLYQIQ